MRRCIEHYITLPYMHKARSSRIIFALTWGTKRRAMISPSIYCTNCGTANVQQAKFCFGCGHALQSGALAASGSLTGLLTHNQELNTRYRIIKKAGKGGFGTVYMAADFQFAYPVLSLKGMNPI